MQMGRMGSWNSNLQNQCGKRPKAAMVEETKSVEPKNFFESTQSVKSSSTGQLISLNKPTRMDIFPHQLLSWSERRFNFKLMWEHNQKISTKVASINKPIQGTNFIFVIIISWHSVFLFSSLCSIFKLSFQYIQNNTSIYFPHNT